MSRLTQRDRSVGTQPLRLRLAVLFCVLLISGAGIAQAAHIHGDWLPKNAAQLSAHSNQTGAVPADDCPLCTVMHSVLPVDGFAALVMGLLLEASLLFFSGRKPETPWYFAAFGRPPPSLLTL